MTADELGTMLGLGRVTVYQGLRSGTIPSIRLKRKYIISRAAIEEWLRTASRPKISGKHDAKIEAPDGAAGSGSGIGAA
jgi:excisionase family DNA binding protein